jgi:hypothetical protein
MTFVYTVSVRPPRWNKSLSVLTSLTSITLSARSEGLPGAHEGMPELALDEHEGARDREPREQIHSGMDDDLQLTEAGPIGDLEEGERIAALLPTGSEPGADNHALHRM